MPRMFSPAILDGFTKTQYLYIRAGGLLLKLTTAGRTIWQQRLPRGRGSSRHRRFDPL